MDKLTYSALEATLGLYRNPEKALVDIPGLKMLTTNVDEIKRRADIIAQSVGSVVEKSEPGLYGAGRGA